MSKVPERLCRLSEALTGDGAAIFRHACGLGPEGIVWKRSKQSSKRNLFQSRFAL
jgi:ATP-dependent DNA ligase